MAGFYSGIDGSLLVDGVAVGKVKQWDFRSDAEVLVTTTLSSAAPTYCHGRAGHNGSCTLLYYENPDASVDGRPLIGSLTRTGAVPTGQVFRLELVARQRSVVFDALVTSVRLSSLAGRVMEANIDFVVTGLLSEASLGGS